MIDGLVKRHTRQHRYSPSFHSIRLLAKAAYCASVCISYICLRRIEALHCIVARRQQIRRPRGLSLILLYIFSLSMMMCRPTSRLMNTCWPARPHLELQRLSCHVPCIGIASQSRERHLSLGSLFEEVLDRSARIQLDSRKQPTLFI